MTRSTRNLASAVLSAICLLALVVIAMAFSQTQLLFPTHAVPQAGPLPAGAEALSVETADGETLRGVHIPPGIQAEGGTTLVIGFGGNGWNGQHVAEELHALYPEAHVVAFHYRGYRPSSGSPSAEALMRDAPLVFDSAVELVKPERTVAVGFSIGSGVAAALSRERELDGLILVTPFDSLKAVARSLYPWLPVGTFFSQEMDAAGALEGSDVPVAIVGAERDEIVPPARTDALRGRVANLAFDRTIPAAGHNDIYGRSEFDSAMREALEAVAPR